MEKVQCSGYSRKHVLYEIYNLPTLKQYKSFKCPLQYTVKSKCTLYELERQCCSKFKSTSAENIVLIWNKQYIRIAT